MNTLMIERFKNGMRLSKDSLQRMLSKCERANAGGNRGNLSDEAILKFAPERTIPVVTNDGQIFYIFE